MYDWLNPEGVFILEPQLWTSYKKKSTLTEVAQSHLAHTHQEIKSNFKKITLKPENFQEYLTTQLKFTLERTIEVKMPKKPKKANFVRPLLLLRK